MVKIDPHAPRLRHARDYAELNHYLTAELYLKGKPLEGLALFDCERAQTDTAWTWLLAQTDVGISASIDVVLLNLANATVYAGRLRYARRRERIPQLEAYGGAARRLGNRGAEGAAIGSLGNAYADLSNYSRAIEYYQKALVIIRELGNQQEEGPTLGNLGNAYKNPGDYQQAIELHEQHLTIAHTYH